MEKQVFLVIAIFAIVNCQLVIHNQTIIQQIPGYGFRQNVTIINTTYVQTHGYGPVQNQGFRPMQNQGPGPVLHQPQYGFRPNLTKYDPYGGYINQTGVKRNFGNDVIVGNPGPYDVILLKQWFVKGPRWLQIREKLVAYPANTWVNNNRVISAVGIFDLAQGPGGHATIVSGGVGHRNVSIRLFSDRGYGFNYKVVIHGR